MTRRWSFAWAWFIGAVLALSFPACGGITLPDSDGDGIPDILDPCPQDPDQSCIPEPPPAEPYDCANPPAISGLVKVPHPVANRYIVVLKPTRAIIGPEDIRAFAAKFKGVDDVKPLVRAFAAKISKASLVAVLADPSVAFVQQEGTKSIPKPKRSLSPSASLSWGLDRVDQRALPLDKNFIPDGDGDGVHVYINDTGVTRTDDLGDRLSDDCFSTIVFQGCNDANGHGTHVAGTAAGNVWGIAKKATVHSVRFLDENGSGTDTDAIRTLDWIAQHPGGGIVNASWGGDPAPAVDAAVCRVIESGKVFVAAAGNESADAYSSTPARVIQVVTVGATDSGDGQAYFSNFGAALDLYAPGVDIESDTPTGGTAVYSGTSMATPHVVGAAALLAAKYPGETPAQIRDRLVGAATKDVLLGLGTGSPNLLLYVGQGAPPPPQCPEECPPGTHCTDPAQGCVSNTVPPKGEPVGADRLLRPAGTRLQTLGGTPVLLNQGVQCCASLHPTARGVKVRRPKTLRIGAAEMNTLWPLISVPAQEYFKAKGATNHYHFRMGPFYTDVDTEVDWQEYGGPYLTPGGEWNPVFWDKVRELAWHAFQAGAYVEVVVIDSWGCKYSQWGNRYVPWPQDAIDACGRTWHPEHERYARKVVEELGCFGNIVWALDNEGQGIEGWNADWFLKLDAVIQDAQRTVGCDFAHMRGSSVPGVRENVDYSITHARQPLTAPISGRWTINNERNPSFSPQEEKQFFAQARAQGLTWSFWRDGMDDPTFEATLAGFKAVVEGEVPADACPKPLAPGSTVYLNDKAYGHGFDSTVRVQGDPEFCQIIHGEPVNDCHLEGWPQRSACEMQLMGGCPIWQYKTAGNATPRRCLQPQHPEASCDHWGTAGGAQDDPHTDAYEGIPFECSYQRDEQGLPSAGFYTVARGIGDIRACKPDGTGCGPWRPFNK